jgi:hypothetical protein
MIIEFSSFEKLFHQLNMKKYLVLILLFLSIGAFAQENIVEFKKGEYLKYKISYGLINAGFASLEINDTILNNEAVFHVVGKGWSTGMVHFFFPVEDDYQTYFGERTIQPHHFIRKVNEGGYTMNREIFFNYNSIHAKVVDHKRDTIKYFEIHKDIQDMVSALYHFRTKDLSDLKEGETISMDIFFDGEINNFKLKLIGREQLKTKFGKVNTLIFKPIVQVGRVFKENESVTLWVTDDKNKLPLKIKASILVGALKAELIEYKGLANSFPVIFN